MDANYRINLAVVIGVAGVAWWLTVGAVVLLALDKPAPEWVGNVILSITSGLVGFLAREIKHAFQTPSDPSRTTLLLQQTTEEEAK